MPYIPIKDRVNAMSRPLNAGELNYNFTETITEYIKNKKLSYQTINDIVGALEGAKAEFQRRIVDKYEDQKIKENSDVYNTTESATVYRPLKYTVNIEEPKKRSRVIDKCKPRSFLDQIFCEVDRSRGNWDRPGRRMPKK